MHDPRLEKGYDNNIPLTQTTPVLDHGSRERGFSDECFLSAPLQGFPDGLQPNFELFGRALYFQCFPVPVLAGTFQRFTDRSPVYRLFNVDVSCITLFYCW